jgi:Metallo-beta-lactamase superfamily
MTRLTKFSLFLVAALLPVASASAQEANVQKLSDDAYSVNLLGYTSLVVVGEKEVLITDTANPYRASLLVKEIVKITDKPVGKIVLSHEHFDHTGGTNLFPDAEIIAQENVKGLADVDPLDLFPDTIDRTFENELTIDMGTTSVRLVYFGAADGVANIVVHLPKEKIALVTDMYLKNALVPGGFLTDTNLLGNRKILNEVAKWDLRYAVNSHMKSTDPADLKATAGFLNDLYNAFQPEIMETLKTNPSQRYPAVIKLSKTLKLPKYAQWGNYKDLPEYVKKMGFAIIHGG